MRPFAKIFDHLSLLQRSWLSVTLRSYQCLVSTERSMDTLGADNTEPRLQSPKAGEWGEVYPSPDD